MASKRCPCPTCTHKKTVHILIPTNMILYSKKKLADVIKNLELGKLSSKSNVVTHVLLSERGYHESPRSEDTKLLALKTE